MLKTSESATAEPRTLRAVFEEMPAEVQTAFIVYELLCREFEPAAVPFLDSISGRSI